MKRERVIISTDGLGLFRQGAGFFMKSIPTELSDIEAEVGAVRPQWRLENFLQELEGHGIKSRHIHGQIGKIQERRYHGDGSWLKNLIEDAKLFATCHILANTPDLTRRFSYIDLVIHSPEVSSVAVAQAIRARPNRNQRIFIENHFPGKRGKNESIKKVIALGGPKQNIFYLADLWHQMESRNSTDTPFQRRWRSVIDSSWEEVYRKPNVVLGALHLDISSLPMDKISTDMWKEVADIRKKTRARVVIERQVATVSGLVGFLDIQKIQKKTAEAINIFSKAGLLDL